MSLRRNKDSKFDKRTIDRKIKKSEFSDQEYKQHLNSLEDNSGNMEIIDIEDKETDDVDEMPVSEDFVD